MLGEGVEVVMHLIGLSWRIAVGGSGEHGVIEIDKIKLLPLLHGPWKWVS